MNTKGIKTPKAKKSPEKPPLTIRVRKQNKGIIEKYCDKGKSKKEYLEYLHNLPTHMPDGGEAVLQALKMLQKCPDRKVSAVARALVDRQIVVIFDPGLGADMGSIEGPNNFERQGYITLVSKNKETGQVTDSQKTDFKIRMHTLIRINTDFINKPLGIASVIAHEIRHILDHEDKSNLHRPGTNYSFNSDSMQMRAQMFSGKVLYELMKLNSNKTYSDKQLHDMLNSFSINNTSTLEKVKLYNTFNCFRKYLRLNNEILKEYNISDRKDLYRLAEEKNKAVFEKFLNTFGTAALKKGIYYLDPREVRTFEHSMEKWREFLGTFREAVLCGRPCVSKDTPCERPVYFPPCYQHHGIAYEKGYQ